MKPFGGFMDEQYATPLGELLLARIAADGPLTFASYMSSCLYEAGLGYYTSPGRKVGAEGDFYTSSNVHRIFGRLVARELCRMWELLDETPEFTVVEVGGGNGRLAADILDGIADLNPRLYAVLTYRLIETEPTLQDVQKRMLGTHAARAAWSTPGELADGSLTFTGCLLSNELIDAFPVHLAERTADGLREVFVTAVDGRFAELLLPPSTPELAAYLERFGVHLAVGQRAEINLEAPRWLAAVAAALDRGFVLTIDYGHLAEELYAPIRMNGTLLCYYRHTVVDDPFLRPGLQDMTAHVNFSALREQGRELGLETVWYGEQYRFLLAAGMMHELLALESAAMTEGERLKSRLALKKLILPEGGMGDTFKVLVQAKGVAEPVLLCRQEWERAL
jgi:SAM-dependent MidA family methyltransferase